METKLSIHAEVLRLFGALDGHKVREIVTLKPSVEELEVTAAYLAGMDDIMGKERRPLTGNAASIYAIVTRDEAFGEDEYFRE